MRLIIETKLSDDPLFTCFSTCTRNVLPFFIVDGLGKFKYKAGDTLSGEWKNGFRHGQIEINYKNGDKFIGQCKNDRIDGVGELTCKNGYHYNGHWKRNLVCFCG